MLSFNDIIGQKSVKAHLIGALQENKISHAYILAGEDGSGKMMLAERFAAALQCDGGPEKPCCACINCMQAESRNHPDIIYVTHEKKNIVVDDIRNQLVNDIAIKPYSGAHKIYIIDDAEKMNEAAQNALLKTLEEPPEYAVIILLATNTGAFLQTILSRCVTLQLKPIETDLIKDYIMEHAQLPDYVAKLCAAFSCGCIGKAMRYAQDENFSKLRENVLRFVKEVNSCSQSELYDQLKDIDSATLSDRFDLMDVWYRDVLMYKATSNAKRIIFAEELSAISNEARERSFTNINDIINSIDTARKRIAMSLSPDLTLQLMCQVMKQH